MQAKSLEPFVRAFRNLVTELHSGWTRGGAGNLLSVWMQNNCGARRSDSQLWRSADLRDEGL